MPLARVKCTIAFKAYHFLYEWWKKVGASALFWFQLRNIIIKPTVAIFRVKLTERFSRMQHTSVELIKSLTQGLQYPSLVHVAQHPGLCMKHLNTCSWYTDYFGTGARYISSSNLCCCTCAYKSFQLLCCNWQ